MSKAEPLGKILLTGPRGSIGSMVLNSFRRKDLERTVVIDISKPRKLPKQVVFYKVDLTEPAVDARLAEILEREQIETVVHMATLWSPGRRRNYAHEVDVIGTMHLLNAAHQHNLRKLVVISSTVVYGAKPTNPNYLSETHHLYEGRSNPYLRDKVEMEAEVRKYRSRHPRSTVTLLRPCMTVGPNIHNFITRMLSAPLIPTILGYDPLVQFLHEADLIRAVHWAIKSDVHGEYNIVGKGVMPLSYAIKVAGKVNLPLVHFMASPVLYSLWQSDIVEFPPALLDFLRYLWVADGRKAQEAGFTARHSSMEALESFTGQERLRRVHLAKTRPMKVVNA